MNVKLRLIAVLLVQVVCAACSRQRELTLLPDGYEGPVLILFSAHDGQPAEYRGKTRVYRIPRSGVLKTEFPAYSGYVDPSFYYARGDTLIRSIRNLQAPEMSSADTGVYAFLFELGTFGKSPGEDTLHDRHYLSFVVGHVSDAESLATRGQRLVNQYWLH
jgi:hypothetical protein